MRPGLRIDEVLAVDTLLRRVHVEGSLEEDARALPFRDRRVRVLAELRVRVASHVVDHAIDIATVDDLEVGRSGERVLRRFERRGKLICQAVAAVPGKTIDRDELVLAEIDRRRAHDRNLERFERRAAREKRQNSDANEMAKAMHPVPIGIAGCPAVPLCGGLSISSSPRRAI